MPFLIRPPLHFPDATSTAPAYTLIEPDQNDRSILRDLRDWGWRITCHQFDDEDFIDALKQVERDAKKRRRQTHAIAGDLYGYNERPTLDD